MPRAAKVQGNAVDRAHWYPLRDFVARNTAGTSDNIIPR
jgi:hypothetical protein